MPLSTQVLGGFKTGMDQQTRQGGKEGAQTLWNLKNGYVNARGDIIARPGLTAVAAVDDSYGLYGFSGQLHVFYTADDFVDPANALIKPHVIRYPQEVAGDSPNILRVPFIGAILGKLYAAVVFVGGLARQYWLQEPAAWKPNTVYLPNQLTQPTTPDGYYYSAQTPNDAQTWKPNTAYQVGDKVQPTKPNGYYYQVTEETGSGISGPTEPVWPAQAGALVFEGSDSSDAPGSSTGGPSSAPVIDPAIQRRYDLLSRVSTESTQ